VALQIYNILGRSRQISFRLKAISVRIIRKSKQSKFFKCSKVYVYSGTSEQSDVDLHDVI